jgi:hypothetical protein
MGKFYRIILLLFVFSILYSAGYTQGKHVPVNLSLVYPISINKSVNDEVDFNFGLIGSKFGSLNGFSINGIYSILEKDINGIQINGIYAETRNKLNGIQLTGLANDVTKGGSGAVIGGLANMVFGDFKGLQLAGITNISLESVKGVQLAGGYNLAGADINILQMAGLGNISGGKMKGVQLSAFFNLASVENRGVQTSLINITARQNGFQLGFMNLADENGGIQVGIVNMITKKQKGTTLGLFYIYPDTKVQLLLTSGNVSYFMIGGRFKTNNIYTMLDFGGPVVHSNTTRSISADFRVGYSFKFKFFDFNTDLGYTHFNHYQNQVEGKDSQQQFAVILRAGFEKEIMKKLGVFLNTGYGFFADSYHSPNFGNKFLIEGGVVVL